MAETTVKKKIGRTSREESEHSRGLEETESKDGQKARKGKVKRKPEKKAVKKEPPKKKKESKIKSINAARMLRSMFLLLIGLLIVYLYYLQTEGILIKSIQAVWTSYKQVILAALAFIAYSGGMFYAGYKKGKK